MTSAVKIEAMQVKIEPLSSSKPSLLATPARTPQESQAKPSLDQRSYSKSRCKSEQEELSRSMRGTPISTTNNTLEIIQRTPHSRCFNYITMGKFNIDSGITRARVCLWTLLLLIKIFSILTAASFWITAHLYLISLIDWQIPLKSIYGVCRAIGGLQFSEQTLKVVFPEGSSGYHARLVVYPSHYYQSPGLILAKLPILIDNPTSLFFLMIFMFIGHHLLCFAHDCLSKFGPMIRAVGSH